MIDHQRIPFALRTAHDVRYIRYSPFHEACLRHGCREFGAATYGITDVSHYPGTFDNEALAYDAVTNAAIVADVCNERPVELRGPDAENLLQHLVTRDIRGLKAGRCRYVLMTDDTGGMIADTIVLRLTADRFWLSGDLGWMAGVATGAGFDVAVEQAEAHPVQLQGPASPAIIAELFGTGAASLGRFQLTVEDWRGMPLLISATGFTGELGFEVYLVDPSRADELWEAIVEAGRPFGLVVTDGSFVPRRVEAGFLSAGADFSRAENPLELGLERFVALNRSEPFVGQKALQDIAWRGPARRLVGVRAKDSLRDPMTRRWPVGRHGRSIGMATTLVRSFRLDATIGFALIDAASARIGDDVEIHTMSGTLQACVVDLPFIESRH